MLSQYGIMNIIYHNLGCFLSHGVETHINEMSDALNIYRYFVHDKCRITLPSRPYRGSKMGERSQKSHVHLKEIRDTCVKKGTFPCPAFNLAEE